MRPSTELPRRVAVLVVMPDAVALDRWDPLARRLDPLGLEVVAASSLMLTPARYAALYAHATFKQARPDRLSTSWLSYASGELDSSIVSVVRTPLDVDLVGLLDAWKGPSDFRRRAAGDLRAVSPAAHRCSSVLHTPDNPRQAASDVRELLGEAVLELAADLGSPPRCRFGELRRLRMPDRADVGSTHPYDIVLRCAIRICAVLAYDYATRPNQAWTDLTGHLLATRDALASATADLAARWDAEASQARVALPDVTLAATTPRHVGGLRTWLAEILRELLTPQDYDAKVSARLEDAFRANELFLDAWERHTLRTALTFPLARAT